MIKKIFIEHPRKVNETSSEHLCEAGYCGSIMLVAGIMCIIHALIPCLFVSSASRLVRNLTYRFDNRQPK